MGRLGSMDVLGQANDAGDIFVWLGILLAALTVLLLAILALRKWLRRQEGDEQAPVGFTLSDLRQLQKSGRMTAEEAERIKAVVVAAAKAAALRREQEAKRPPAQRRQGP